MFPVFSGYHKHLFNSQYWRARGTFCQGSSCTWTDESKRCQTLDYSCLDFAGIMDDLNLSLTLEQCLFLPLSEAVLKEIKADDWNLLLP